MDVEGVGRTLALCPAQPRELVVGEVEPVHGDDDRCHLPGLLGHLGRDARLAGARRTGDAHEVPTGDGQQVPRALEELAGASMARSWHARQ